MRKRKDGVEKKEREREREREREARKPQSRWHRDDVGHLLLRILQ
jgi:hypothetical protein